VADPTGSFTVYAGKYQPQGALFLSEAAVPQFVSILGRGRLYFRDEVSYVSIWLNEICSTTEAVRNNWVILTAERTLDRLEALKTALSAGLEGDALRAKLLDSNVAAILAEGIVHAVPQYNGSQVVADLVPVIASALDTVVEPSVSARAHAEARGEQNVITDRTALKNERQSDIVTAESRDFAPVREETQDERNVVTDQSAPLKYAALNGDQSDQKGKLSASENSAATEALARNKERVIITMTELDAGSGVPYDRLIETLEIQGLEEDEVEEAVQELMEEGKCYEPRLGILKLI
jgi:hypothetical protein